ncbi:MAG: VCBS repeat-containing protein, partial [Puniceicoccaceae bacterium]
NDHSAAHHFKDGEMSLIYHTYEDNTIQVNHTHPTGQLTKILGSIPFVEFYSWFQKDKNSFPKFVAKLPGESPGMIDFSIWETTKDGLLDASPEPIIFSCEKNFGHSSFTMANIANNDEFELISSHECSNRIYYWQKDSAGRYSHPVALYTPEDPDTQAHVVIAAPGLSNGYDELIISIGGLLYLFNNGDPIPFEENDTYLISQIFNSQGKDGKNQLFALYFNSVEGAAYLRQIHKIDGEVSFSEPIMLLDRTSTASQPISSSTLIQYDSDDSEDLVIVFENQVIVVENYALNPVVNSYELTSNRIRENRAISIIDLNGDGVNDIVLGGTGYIANPAL